MKYWNILASINFDLKTFEKYTVRKNEKYGLIKIEFDDSDIESIRSIWPEKFFDYIFIGKDNYIYTLTKDSFLKGKKCPVTIRCGAMIRLKRHIKKRRTSRNNMRILLQRENGIFRDKIHSNIYKAFSFTDKENSIAFKYRLKLSENKSPLVVYFHGAGAMGINNQKQFFEFLPMKKYFKDRECNILLPQAPVGTNAGVCEQADNYFKAVKNLLDTISAYDCVDKDRIYIFGTSFGGGCVWNMIWNYPDFFACALPVMGALTELWRNKDKKLDFSRIAKVPLWVAHSSDDTNVRIDEDDFCVEELRKLGSDVKYTRWDKYGHNMSSKFYKQEPWVEWMFSQNRKGY